MKELIDVQVIKDWIIATRVIPNGLMDGSPLFKFGIIDSEGNAVEYNDIPAEIKTQLDAKQVTLRENYLKTEKNKMNDIITTDEVVTKLQEKMIDMESKIDTLTKIIDKHILCKLFDPDSVVKTDYTKTHQSDDPLKPGYKGYYVYSEDCIQFDEFTLTRHDSTPRMWICKINGITTHVRLGLTPTTNNLLNLTKEWRILKGVKD